MLDLIYCYKIVFGLTKLNFDFFLEFSTLPTRGHAYKLFKPRSSNARVNVFACRVISVWNGLPDFVSFTSIAAFKRSIGQLLALHMQPCCPACTFYCE